MIGGVGRSAQAEAGYSQEMARPGIHPSLSMGQSFALLSEAQSAQNLMRDTVTSIASLREPVVHSDAVFTLGSIGVEKTAKILLGCAAVEADGRWPTKKTMQDWGHDIETLVTLLLDTATRNQADAVATGYVSELIGRVRSSNSLPLLFATLSRYGRSGRFHYLDILATGAAGKFDAPTQYWERLENVVAKHLGGAPFGGPPEEFEAFLGKVSASIAHDLDVWWFIMHRLAIQGCFGALGKKLGWELWPYLRPDPLKN